MSGWLIVAVVLAVLLAAPRYGADSRAGIGRASRIPGPGGLPAPRPGASVRADLAAVWSALTGRFRRTPSSC